MDNFVNMWISVVLVDKIQGNAMKIQSTIISRMVKNNGGFKYKPLKKEKAQQILCSGFFSITK